MLTNHGTRPGWVAWPPSGCALADAPTPTQAAHQTWHEASGLGNRWCEMGLGACSKSLFGRKPPPRPSPATAGGGWEGVLVAAAETLNRLLDLQPNAGEIREMLAVLHDVMTATFVDDENDLLARLAGELADCVY